MVSAEVKLLVLMRIREKSGIHVDGTDSEWLGPELDSVAPFELGDELVGAESSIGARGLAEGGGFAASEGGEALLPVRQGRPVPLKLTTCRGFESGRASPEAA